MKITQREMFLGLAAMTAILGGSIWYVADKNFNEWKLKATQIEDTQGSIRKNKTAIKMQATWMDELTQLQSELPTFDLQKKSVSPELVKIIKAVADTYQLDITRTQPFAEKATGDLFELGINCTWEGSLEAMVQFLTDIQQQGVRYDVRSLNVKPLGKNSGKLTGNMVIHCAYTRKDLKKN